MSDTFQFLSVQDINELSSLLSDNKALVILPSDDDNSSQGGTQKLGVVTLDDYKTWLTTDVNARIDALESGTGNGYFPSPITLTLTGPVTGSVSFDGSQNVSWSSSIANGALSLAMVSGLVDALDSLENGSSIQDGSLSLAKLADIEATTLLGNASMSIGAPTALDTDTVRILLNLDQVENTALSTYTGFDARYWRSNAATLSPTNGTSLPSNWWSDPARISLTNVNNASGYPSASGAAWSFVGASGASSATYGRVFDIFLDANVTAAPALWTRNYSASGAPNAWARFLTTNDVGAGNGLDADTLDGQDGTYYTNLSNGTGTLAVGQGGTGATSLTGLLKGNGAAAVTAAAAGTDYVLPSGNITGNAATANKLASSVTIGIAGAVTGTATSFDGSSNITINTTAFALSAATGTLSVSHGGTGIASYTAGNYLSASSSSALQQRTPAQVLADIGALSAESYTASDVLTKLKTVDGAGSGLDADLLDGQHGSYYLDFTHATNLPTTLAGYGITDGITQASADSSYLHTLFNALNSDASPGTTFWTQSLRTIGTSLNSTGSTNYPGTFGATWSFITDQGDSISGYQRAFDIHKASAVDGLYLRTYNTSTGDPLSWHQVWHDGNFAPGDYLPIAGGEVTGTVSFESGVTFEADVTLAADLLPDADNTRSLGSPTLMWKDVYVGPGSLYINGQQVLSNNDSQIIVSADSGQDIAVLTKGTGDILMQPTGTGNIQLKSTVIFQAGAKLRSSDGNSIDFGDSITFGAGSGVTGGLTIDGYTAYHTGNLDLSDYLTTTGNAATASKLASAVTIALSGAATGTATSFDGSVNITIPVTALDLTKGTGTLSVAHGGTGKTSWTTGGILYASATGTLAQYTPAQLLSIIGAQATSADLSAIAAVSTTGFLTRTGSGEWITRSFGQGTGIGITYPDGVSGAPVISNTGVTSVTGTAKQVIVSGSAGTVVFSLPQSIDSTSAPSFAQVTVASDPASAMEVATKQYVDNLAIGLDPHTAVAAASTGNLSLSGLSAIDGYTPVANDRILAKDQTDASANGIYVAAGGAWSRASDMDGWSEVPNSFVFVKNGTTNGSTGWMCSAPLSGTLGTTDIPWAQFSAATVMTGTAPIVVSGNSISLAPSGVTSGSYGSATTVPVLTLDTFGRVTAAQPVTITPLWASIGSKPTTLTGFGITDAVPSNRTVSAGTGLSGGGALSGNITLNLANTTVSAGSYGDATDTLTLTVDAQGRLTAVSTVALAPAWSQVTDTPTTLSGYGITDAQSLIAAAAPHLVYATASSGTANASPTLRALVAADIPSLSTTILTSGTLGVARGGTGAATLTGLIKGNGTSAMTAAVAGTDYVIPSGSITGNAATATTLANARTIALSGSVTGTATAFDGSANITIPVTSVSLTTVTGTLAAAHGGTGLASFTAGNYLNAASSTTLQQRTPAQVLADIGALDASTYTAADVLTKLKTVDGSGSGLDADTLDGQQGTYYLSLANSTGTLSVAHGGTGATSLTGMLKGNGTGAFTAATAGLDYVTPSGTITGNAGSATKWATARTITLGGVLTGSTSIDGSTNVTLTAAFANFNIETTTAGGFSSYDDITTAGFYSDQSLNGHPGAPFGQLMVAYGGGTSVGQLYFDGQTTDHLWLRQGNPLDSGGTWGDWTRLLTLIDLDPTTGAGAGGDNWDIGVQRQMVSSTQGTYSMPWDDDSAISKYEFFNKADIVRPGSSTNQPTGAYMPVQTVRPTADQTFNIHHQMTFDGKGTQSLFIRYSLSGQPRFVDMSTWQANATVSVGAWIKPSVPTGFYYEVSTAGATGTTEPAWPTTSNATVTDGSAVWTAHWAWSDWHQIPDAVHDITVNGAWTFKGATVFNGAITSTQPITLPGDPSSALQAVTKQYVDNHFVSSDTTYLGYTGTLSMDSATTTAALWSALPVGYSRMMSGTIGTGGGAPTATPGYFTKLANRDTSGGWGGLWLSYSSVDGHSLYTGVAATSSNLATWSKLWSAANDGAGSGLDADLLDGQEGSYYAAAGDVVHLDTAETITGQKTLTAPLVQTNPAGSPALGMWADNYVVWGASGAPKGTLVIKTAMPSTAAVMFRMEVEGYDLSMGGFEYLISGYFYPTNSDIYNFRYSQNSGTSLTVRGGVTTDGFWCIMLGSDTTSWNYPSFRIRGMQSYQNTLAYITGASASLVTDTTGYTQVSSASPFGGIPFGQLIQLPTTVAGYGITDALTDTTGDSRYIQKGVGINGTDASVPSNFFSINGITHVGNGAGSTGFPFQYGATWSFTEGQGSSSSSYYRSFDLWKGNDSAHALWWRSYDASAGTPNAWNQIWDSSSFDPTTYNAPTASKLATAVTINGVSFDGSSNITVVAAAPNALTFGNGFANGSYTGASAATITLGAPTTVGNGSTNTVTATGHSHAISLAASDIPSLPTSILTSGTLSVARGGTGAATLTGLVKASGTAAFTAAVAGTDYVVPSGSITGNAGTATALATARTINGVSFDGSANITITAAAPSALTFGNGLTGTSYTGAAASTVALGTPGTVGNGSSNSVTSTSHTHAISLAASDIPSLSTSILTSGTLPVTRGGTGNTSITGLVKGNGSSAFSVATAGTDYIAPNTAVALTSVTLSGDPTSALQAATKQYVDNAIQGLSIKNSVVVASTANLSLSGLSAIDGYTPSAGDRILAMGQTTAANNGIYLAASGSWTRAADASTWAELVGAFVFVEQGTTYASTGWVTTVAPGGTLGTTAITFTQFAGVGTVTQGTGILVSGNQVSLATSGVGAGSYTKVTVDVYGRVTAGTSLSASDIPNLSAATITSGTLPVARGGTGITSYTVGSYLSATASTTLSQRTPAQVLSDIGALAATSYTAADVLAKLLTVDGAGSSLDADTVDGIDSSDFTRVSLTGLGRTTSWIYDGTTNTPAAWSALPVGYSRMMGSSIGTVGGLPEDNYVYFTKMANRDQSGGWWGIANSGGSGNGHLYMGGTGTSDSFATWTRIWTANDFDPTTFNAPTAAKLATARSITLTGGATGSTSFDGSTNVSLSVTGLNAGSVNSGTLPVTYGGTGLTSYTAGNYVNAASSSTLQQRTPAQVLSDIGALASSSYTAADVLAKLLTVDGSGSGLDADKLDGQQGSYYATDSAVVHLTGTETIAGQKTFKSPLVTYDNTLGGVTAGFWTDNAVIWGTNTSTQTGALVVDIGAPSTASIMFKAVFDGFDYSTSTTGYRYEVAGYFYAASTSVLYFQYMQYGSYTIPVRAGVTPDGNWCLILGADTTVWHYPKLRIKTMLSYSSAQLAYAAGTTATLVTDTTSYTHVVTAPNRASIPWTQLLNVPSTVAGYGITDALTTTIPSIPSGADLNTYTTGGVYYQGTNAYAAAGTNYPVPYAGLLEVFKTNSFCWQRYTLYTGQNSLVFVRNWYSTAWGSWQQQARTADNVASATKLATARTINGVAFDGTANITLPVNSTSLAVTNTRTVYPEPYSVGRKNNITWDFMTNATLSRSGEAAPPAVGTYSTLQTVAGWGDASGGNTHELAWNNGGIYHRQSSVTSSSVNSWSASVATSSGATIQPNTANGYYYTCTTAGTTGNTEPTWPTTAGDTVTDGTVVWTAHWFWTDWTQLIETGCTIANGSTLVSWTGGAYIASSPGGQAVRVGTTASTGDLLDILNSSGTLAAHWDPSATFYNTGDIVATGNGTTAAQMRFANPQNSYGYIWRQDSTAFYLLHTASDDQNGTFTTDRPLAYSASTNTFSSDAGWSLSGVLTAGQIGIGTGSTPLLLYSGTNANDSTLTDLNFRTGSASHPVYYQMDGQGNFWTKNGAVKAGTSGGVTLQDGAQYSGLLLSAGFASSLTSSTTVQPGAFGKGNGDGASFSTNDVAVYSWWGIGFGPSISGQSIAIGSYSHYFNTRSGDAGFQGALSLGGGLTVASTITSSATSVIVSTGTEGQVHLGSNDYYYFGNANNAGYYGTSEGYAYGFNFASATFTVYGTFNATSDERCKTDFKPMHARPLWRWLDMQSWQWRGSKKAGYGPTAQQVLGCAPEYVQENKTVSVEETNRSGTEAIEASKARIEAGEEQGMLSVDKVTLALEMAMAAGQMVDKLQREVKALRKELARERRRNRRKDGSTTPIE